MTKRNVMIYMSTTRLQVAKSLFDEINELFEDDGEEDTPLNPDDTPESSELWMEGKLVTNSHRVEIIYEESELSGMEGSVTSIGFDRNAPGLVSMMRSGLVSTAMVFEKGKRHICVYDTPFSSFQICILARKVENRLLTEGTLELDYLIEIHGAQAERCQMTLRLCEEKTEQLEKN